MIQIGNIQDIKKAKKCFDDLEENGLIRNWELPYENLLTRLSAAAFYFDSAEDSKLETIWKKLETIAVVKYQPNRDSKLSSMCWEVKFEP